MKYVRYRGEFVSVKGNVWKAEIWQEAEQPFFGVKELTFDAEQPITIEWDEAAKEEVICGSTATVRLISPTDRAYEDLYTIEAGSVRLDVYRNDSLYWSGCIDTEFYEEPYEKLDGYTVELTFSDFGILKRLKCNMQGMMTLREITTACLHASQIKYNGIDDTMVSTQLPGTNQNLTGNEIAVHTANFYDEDEDSTTLDEVLEGIMQPLALKVKQKNGKIFVFDLNGLYNSTGSREIWWNGDAQTLSTDKVYSEARITFSPYVRDGNQWPDHCWAFIKTDPNAEALDMLEGKESADGKARYYTWHASTEYEIWRRSRHKDCGFTMWTADTGKNVKLHNNGLKYFTIIPQVNGTKADGIAMYFKILTMHPGGVLYSAKHGYQSHVLQGVDGEYKARLTTGKKAYLPPLLPTDKLKLRVTLEALMDARTNFFIGAENMCDGNKEKDWAEGGFKKWANILYIPVRIIFKPTGSDTHYIWDNRKVVRRSLRPPVRTIEETFGEWKVLPADQIDPPADRLTNEYAYLAYYDTEDRAETSGVGGWKTNRPAINPHTQKLVSVLSSDKGGQYIPYPTFGDKGGEIWMEVCGGWIVQDGNAPLMTEVTGNSMKVWDKNAWAMIKMPKLEIMSNIQFDAELDTSDIEYTGRLNKYASEPIEIDTICGTAEEGVPTARGAYYKTSDNKQVTQLTRAGRTETAEDLLIGTLYSQYADRKTMLSGEADIIDGDETTLTEQNQEGKKLLCVSDVQDVRMETSDASFIELRPDEYKKDEEV